MFADCSLGVWTVHLLEPADTSWCSNGSESLTRCHPSKLYILQCLCYMLLCCVIWSKIMLLWKGTASKGAARPEMWKTCQYFILQASYDSSVNIYAAEVLIALNSSDTGCSPIASLFTSEEQKVSLWWCMVVWCAQNVLRRQQFHVAPAMSAV